MAFISFTKKYEDKSKEDGFEFVFYCDVGNEPITTEFVKSSSDEKAKNVDIVEKGIGFGEKLIKDFGSAIPNLSESNKSEIESGGELAVDILKKYGDMSPQWHKEHDEAFKKAQSDVKKNFSQCPKCNRWACVHCWDLQKKLCVEDAKKFITCPLGHLNEISNKFCTTCGKPLVVKCTKGGETYPLGTKFCPVHGVSLSQ